MRDEPDMTAPVTRGELRESLELWSGAIIAQVTAQFSAQLTAAMTAFEQRMTALLDDRITGVETRLIAELRRHTNASNEQMRTDVSVVDEKYQDLPGRVTKLEAKVFAPKRTRRS